MLFRVFAKSELISLINGFAKEHQVIGAIKRDSAYAFSDITNTPELFEPSYTTTYSSPKRYLLPSKEELFSFDLNGEGVASDKFDYTPRVLFGLHACDINAIRRLDDVYLSKDYIDPYYKARRDNTMVVGIDCMPQETCFCKAFGTNEAYICYDMFLYDIGDEYLALILSVKAAEILEVSCTVRQATPKDNEIFLQKKRQFDAAFPKLPDFSRAPMLIDASFTSDVWTELGSSCLSCSACAAVCPTCHCFTTKDEVSLDGETGKRIRKWDACTSPSFSRIAHGIDFRPKPENRVRNRMYHKLLGFRLNHGHTLCVGCGRCIVACKANINPVRLMSMLQNEDGYLAEGDQS